MAAGRRAGLPNRVRRRVRQLPDGHVLFVFWASIGGLQVFTEPVGLLLRDDARERRGPAGLADRDAGVEPGPAPSIPTGRLR